MREHPLQISRRQLLGSALTCIAIGTSAARAEQLPLLDPATTQARALKYVEDARKASGATRGSSCANCSLYQGKSGAATGPCQLFPGKQVTAAGCCTSWAPQM